MRAGYLIDTDWIIDHLNGVAAVTARLHELRSVGLAVSIISLAELYEGVHYSRDPVRSEASLQQFLSGLSVLSIDDEVCRIFGRHDDALHPRRPPRDAGGRAAMGSRRQPGHRGACTSETTKARGDARRLKRLRVRWPQDRLAVFFGSAKGVSNLTD